ncbi:hypothetical protein IE53DRAFT_409469 [Violaceomyces palustris]|uniref:Uncharacterized protein n=1 Tax=Violaceomyces palustris TaxID=1673888 RepID=A0ACD0P2Z9_9BASI|nr:hypothetical protein IE53DRAFT_409469 [Violaceomyces palustris]
MATYSPSELVTDVMSPGTTSSLLAEMRSKHSFHHHHGQSSSPRALPAHPPGQFLSQSRSAALDQSANGNREHEASIGDNPSSSSSHFPSSSSSSSPSKLAGGLNDSRYDQNTLGERGKDRNRGGHDQTDQVMGDDQHEGRNVGDGAEENENQGEREADDADADEASSPIASPDDEAEEEEEEEEDEEEEEEEEESPFDFLQNFDPSLFSSGFNDTPSLPSAASSGQGQQTNPQPNDTEFYSNIIQMLTHLLGSSNHGLWPSGAATPNGQSGASPIPIAYSSPASAFTPLPNHAVPKGLAPPPPVQKGAQGSQSRNSSNSNLPDLQPLINSLLSRLSGQTNAAKKAGPVREQELTALLQSLMAQQQEQQKRNSFQQEQHQFQHVGNAPHQFSSSANTPSQTASRPMGFADLVFEDEDEDDPDFNPDINSEFPLPSAWNLAVQDVVGSEESRAAAAAAAAAAKDLGTVGATPTSGVEKDRDTFEGRQRAGTPPTQTDSAAGLTFVQVVSPSGRPMRSTRRKNASDPTDSLQGQDAANQTGMNHVRGMEVNVMVEDGHQERHGSTEAGPPKKRGRKAYYTEEEARRRRLERNAHYAREKRRRMREEKEAAEAAKAAEKEATTWESEKVIPRDQDVRLKEAFLELRAENRMLRAELERMREENARLRAQREIGVKRYAQEESVGIGTSRPQPSSSDSCQAEDESESVLQPLGQELPAHGADLQPSFCLQKEQLEPRRGRHQQEPRAGTCRPHSTIEDEGLRGDGIDGIEVKPGVEIR